MVLQTKIHSHPSLVVEDKNEMKNKMMKYPRNKENQENKDNLASFRQGRIILDHVVDLPEIRNSIAKFDQPSHPRTQLSFVKGEGLNINSLENNRTFDVN